MPTKILHKDYTKLGSAYQLILPLNTEILIPRDAPVRLVRYAIGGMNLEPLTKDLNSALAELKKNGEYQKIYDKWFSDKK